ncbi:Single-stranded-DNA-specific exonuclease RecJ [hydrothermal vent metagenome]|uniref:Single-stranded-DNA-specific exonuclease RecJ n=1 Tax=hydrothermal vent metagenome TaxID=652676 RepID=A0A3B0RL30_9ZZZZ
MSTPEVKQSASGKVWNLRETDATVVADLARVQQVPEIVAKCLAGRGITMDTAQSFLHPTLREQFPDPSSFADMDKAVDLILQALEQKTKITVFADYDVDGATSSAQLRRWLRQMGSEAGLYVPDRLTEGYGPSAAAFQKIADTGTKLVITVDCGAVSVAAITAAKKIGLTVIVLDHHLMGQGVMPPADALVNPNREDDNSGCGYLAAAGLVFVLLAALNRKARESGCFKNKAEPNLLELLELAALGTVCDVASLQAFNRVLVAQGLKAMTNLHTPGLAAFAEITEIEPPFSTYHAGFVFGPRINAGGRIGKSDLGARLLASDDPAECLEIAAELDRLNIERKDIEKQVQDEAMQQVEDHLLDDAVLVVAGRGWHPGVIGIVAGRIKDKYNRPSIVIALGEDGIGHGSGRSISGVNLGDAFSAAVQAGVLQKGGGHAMAGGLTMDVEQLDPFRQFLLAEIGEQAKAAGQHKKLWIDAVAGLHGVGLDLAKNLSLAEPFGMGNPEPVLMFKDVFIGYSQELNGGHVRCTFETEIGDASVSAICFRASDRGLATILLEHSGAPVHVAGKLRVDRWKGREKVSFQIEDVAWAEENTEF